MTRTNALAYYTSVLTSFVVQGPVKWGEGGGGETATVDFYLAEPPLVVERILFTYLAVDDLCC
jgi:hypothetical protein